MAGAWAANTDRIFHVLVAGTDAVINGLTIRDGGGAEDSSGVFPVGDVTLTMSNAIITSNETTGDVGAIWNNGGTVILRDVSITDDSAAACCSALANSPGTMTLERVTARGNTTEDDSGIYTDDTLTITDSTISGNTATGAASTEGAGILHDGGTTTITNSTISGNSTTTTGGGIYADAGSLTINNSTIRANVADSDTNGSGDGGGIAHDGGTVTISNTILGGNADRGGQAPDCSGTVTSGGSNIVQSTTGCTFAPGAGDLVGVDPRLGPLADNGGTTQNHGLLKGSPAVNAGGPGCTTADQRGLPRTDCDIGAVELVLCQRVAVNRFGGTGNDRIAGTPGADGILGFGGKDRLSGKGGKDGLCGGPGKDTLKGGGGKDRLDGGPGKDLCNGGPGRDKAKSCEREKQIP